MRPEEADASSKLQGLGTLVKVFQSLIFDDTRWSLGCARHLRGLNAQRQVCDYHPGTRNRRRTSMGRVCKMALFALTERRDRETTVPADGGCRVSERGIS